MVIANYYEPRTLELRNKNGDNYALTPGRYTGVFNILSFVDTPRGIAKNSKFFEIAFTVVDSAGVLHRHLNILHWEHLWPSGGIVVQPAIGHYGSEHARIKNVFDTRDQSPVECATGEMLTFAKVHNDIELNMREEPHGIAVRLTAYSGGHADSCGNKYRSVDYVIPLDRLLWRKAPVYCVDDISAESADYVDLMPLETPLSGPVIIPGLCPSPIRKLD